MNAIMADVTFYGAIALFALAGVMLVRNLSAARRGPDRRGK